MGADSVDLTARTDGLLPFWLLIVLVAIWILTLLFAWRRRDACPERLPRNLAIGSLFVANALFFWRPMFSGAHLPRGGGDLNSFFFTLHAYSADRVSSGEIPLWNPFLHGGMPQLGNFQAAVIYPPNLIAHLTAQPFTYATLEWLAIGHYLIASLGGYLLLRALGAGRIGAVAGGVLFAYGGFFVAHLGHYSMISAAAWLPWLFWAVLRLVGQRSWLNGAVLALLAFLTASGGHQQTLLFALGGIAIWWLFLMAQQAGVTIPGIGHPDLERGSSRDAWRGLWSRAGATAAFQFGAGISAGLLLAAPMILPSLQLAQRSVRSTLSIEQASEFSVQPVALLQLFLPKVFGSNPTDYWGAFSSGEIWGYIGVTTIVVAVIGIVLRPSAHRIFFAALAILALLYALGPAAPVHGWFYQFVPGFDLVRAPARAYVYFNLALAVLAGLAVSDLARRMPQPDVHWNCVTGRSIRILIVVIGAIGLIIIPVFYTKILGVDAPSNRPVITVENLWMLLIFLSLLTCILWLMRLRLLREAALGIALTAVLALDLFSATMPFNPTEEDLVASYREPEITAYLQERMAPEEPFRIEVQHPGLLPNFGVIDGIHVASGVFDPMQPSAYTTIFNVLSESPENPGYNLLNLRYVVLSPELDPSDGFELAFESSAGNQLWERSASLPRAWFVSEVIDLEHEAQIDALRDASFDPAQTVLIEDPPVQPDGSSEGSVSISRYEPERMTFEVDADGPGYLVISEGDYPGWAADVDGDPETILSANHGIRAIPVDEHTHQVELRYAPQLVTVGSIAAVIGGLALLAMLIAPVVIGRIPSERIRD